MSASGVTMAMAGDKRCGVLEGSEHDEVEPRHGLARPLLPQGRSGERACRYCRSKRRSWRYRKPLVDDQPRGGGDDELSAHTEGRKARLNAFKLLRCLLCRSLALSAVVSVSRARLKSCSSAAEGCDHGAGAGE